MYSSADKFSYISFRLLAFLTPLLFSFSQEILKYFEIVYCIVLFQKFLNPLLPGGVALFYVGYKNQISENELIHYTPAPRNNIAHHRYIFIIQCLFRLQHLG